jgi:hypothetical protein
MRHNVKSPSGNLGWVGLLREFYVDLDDFRLNDKAYGIARRLGFKDAKEAWEANPCVRKSTDPTDVEKARPA